MTFKSGQSGNPAGRKKGIQDKRTQLAQQLIAPHVPDLIARTIALGLDGDVQALRLLLERAIPKVQQQSTGVALPSKMDEKGISRLKGELLQAAIEGRISAMDAEKLIKLIDDTYKTKAAPVSINFAGMTPTDASRVYQQIMCGEL